MATGPTTFLWYALCCGFVGFVSLVGLALFVVGERRRRRREPPTATERRRDGAEAP